jgi:competence protein ComEC
MVAGGLWCALWAGRWRLLGVVPLALGLGLAPTERRPDVLVGRGTALVAVRDPQGRLSALAGPGTNFELARWLEHDGDTRAPAEVAKAHAFRCDGIGCTAYVSGKLLAVATTPAALRDDCASAAILVIKFAKPRGCTRPLLTIDVDDVAARGPHALYLDTKGIRVETVNGLRGNRPWARSESASSH